MVKGKKGAEMTIGTIVVIVLAIVVLVVLVLGFSTGWKDLWGRITSFFGSTNVDTIVQACGVACDTGSKNAFCFQERTVRADTPTFWVKDGKLVSATGAEATAYDKAKAGLATAQATLKTVKETDSSTAAEILAAETSVSEKKKALEKVEVKQEKSVTTATCKQLEDYKNLNFPDCLAIDCTTPAA